MTIKLHKRGKEVTTDHYLQIFSAGVHFCRGAYTWPRANEEEERPLM